MYVGIDNERCSLQRVSWGFSKSAEDQMGLKEGGVPPLWLHVLPSHAASLILSISTSSVPGPCRNLQAVCILTVIEYLEGGLAAQHLVESQLT